jgi:hypothetical protein
LKPASIKESYILYRKVSPIAVLALPIVLLKSDEVPIAVFLLPVTLEKSDLIPAAVLSSPVVLKKEDVKGLDFIMQLRPVTYQFDG